MTTSVYIVVNEKSSDSVFRHLIIIGCIFILCFLSYAVSLTFLQLKGAKIWSASRLKWYTRHHIRMYIYNSCAIIIKKDFSIFLKIKFTKQSEKYIKNKIREAISAEWRNCKHVLEALKKNFPRTAQLNNKDITLHPTFSFIATFFSFLVCV